MDVHSPDDIEKILEHDEEKDDSNIVSSDVKETSSSDLVRTLKSFDF